MKSEASGSGEAAGFDAWVLGRAQDGGVPHLGCERACCAQARRAGLREYPCSLGICDRRTGKLLLIEATPAVEPQIALLHTLSEQHGRGRRPVDALLITHAHIGHYAGLMEFGEEVAATEHLPLFVTPKMASFLREHAPWSQTIEYGQVSVNEVTPGETCEPLEGLCVEFVPVPHRDELSDTMAFKVRGPAATLLWAPDVDRWDKHPGLMDRLLEGVDVALVDGTFLDEQELQGRDPARVPHPLMQDTMHDFADAARPGAIRFIHMNHTNAALRDASVIADIEARGFAVATQGMHAEL